MNGSLEEAYRLDKQQMQSLIRNLVEPLSDGCWIWQGTTSRNAGLVMVGGKRYMARRLAYVAFRLKPRLKEGDRVLVTCNKPGCVNPKCMYVGKGKKASRPVGVDGNRKYPWHEWLTKREFSVTMGKDFDVSVKSMRSAIRKVLVARGVGHRMRVQGDTITVEVTGGKESGIAG